MSTLAGADDTHNGSCNVEDSIWIRATPQRVFRALTEADELACWWPKSAESSAVPGGRLVLTWFTGGALTTSFDTLLPNQQVSFPFYDESLHFALSPERDGTRLFITHRCSPAAVVHVAQAWGFLKANLKSVIEHGIDLRA